MAALVSTNSSPAGTGGLDTKFHEDPNNVQLVENPLRSVKTLFDSAVAGGTAASGDWGVADYFCSRLNSGSQSVYSSVPLLTKRALQSGSLKHGMLVR